MLKIINNAHHKNKNAIIQFNNATEEELLPEEELDKYIKTLENLSAQGNHYASYILFVVYTNDDTFWKKKALHYLKLANHSNIARSYAGLGYLYKQGVIYDKNIKLAVKNYKKAFGLYGKYEKKINISILESYCECLLINDDDVSLTDEMKFLSDIYKNITIDNKKECGTIIYTAEVDEREMIIIQCALKLCSMNNDLMTNSDCYSLLDLVALKNRPSNEYTKKILSSYIDYLLEKNKYYLDKNDSIWVVNSCYYHDIYRFLAYGVDKWNLVHYEIFQIGLELQVYECLLLLGKYYLNRECINMSLCHYEVMSELIENRLVKPIINNETDMHLYFYMYETLGDYYYARREFDKSDHFYLNALKFVDGDDTIKYYVMRLKKRITVDSDNYQIEIEI